MPATAAAADTSVTMQFADDAPRSVAAGAAYTGNLIVRNEGPDVASEASVWVSVAGRANDFSPTGPGHPEFKPVLTYASGCQAITQYGECTLGAMAVGETRTIPVVVTGITHFGSLGFSLWGQYKVGDSYLRMYQDGTYRTRTVQITNGKRAVVSVEGFAPEAATGRTDVAVTGEFANEGPDTIDQGVLFVSATAFDSKGDAWHGYNRGDAARTEVSSIRGVKLSNGAVCAPRVIAGTPAVTKVNEYACPLNGILPGTRVGIDATVNFPTDAKDAAATVTGSVISTSELAEGSIKSFQRYITINPRRTIDLQTTVTSQAMIGAGRTATLDVTVKNAGTARAEAVSLGGDATSGQGGMWAKDTLPGRCSSLANRSAYVRCGMGDIPAGQSRTIKIDVTAGKTLGQLGILLNASSFSAVETNWDDNAEGVILTIVKPNTVPFLGVKLGKFKKAPTKMAAFLNYGDRVTATCPVKCKATVALQVKRSVAERMGLVAKAKMKKGKKKPSPFVVIGTASKVSDAKGNVIVKVKAKKAFVKKLKALRAPLAVSRVTTVVSIDPRTKDASTVKTSKLTIKPLPPKKKKG